MHILFTNTELGAVKALKLPEGTTLVESAVKGKPLRRLEVKNGSLVTTTNFVEQDRPWKTGEAEVFMKDMDREKVVDFFLHYQDGSGPQREYSAMRNAGNKFLKYIRPDGSYHCDKKTNKMYSLFRISLNRDSDIDAAEKEIRWCIEKVAAFYPEYRPLYMPIFEHTLSQYGSYAIHWDGVNLFELKSNNRILARFNDLRSTLVHIAKYHYYE